MRSRLILSLAGAGVIVACSGDALAATPLSNTCYDVGFECFTAGPDGDQTGTCVAATCYDLLDASFACGTCELDDGGSTTDAAMEGAAPDAEPWDAGTPDGEAVDAGGTDAAPESDGSTLDATPSDGAAEASPTSSGGSSSGSGAGSSSGSGTAPASSSGDTADAGADPEETMPGCTISPMSGAGPTGFVVLAFGLAAVGARRRAIRR